MDKNNKIQINYYKTLASVYQLQTPCEDCYFKNSKQDCYKNKEHCANRLFITMDRLLK